MFAVQIHTLTFIFATSQYIVQSPDNIHIGEREKKPQRKEKKKQ